MHSKITTTLLIASVLGLMACSTDDGKNSSISIADAGVKQTSDVNIMRDAFVSQGSVADLIADKKISLEKDIENEGCDENMGKVIDLSVKKGDRVITKTLISGQGHQSETIRASTILTATVTQTMTLEEILSVNVSSPNLGEILTKKISYHSSCHVNDESCASNLDTDDYMNSLTPQAQNFYNSAESKNYIYCNLREEIEDSSTKEFGTYKLASGKEIKATRSIRISHGMVVCSRNGYVEEMGIGESTQITIRSNEISPGTQKYYCGGVAVLYGTTVKFDGKVIQSDRTEQITPVLRN